MPKKLVIKRAGFRKRVVRLFDKLDRDERKMKAFVKNPTKVLSTDILKGRVPKQQESESNRLLFAILANDQFRSWLDGYVESNRRRRITDNKFAQDFAQAVIEFGDDSILLAVLKSQGRTIRLPGMGNRFQQLIVNNPAKQATVTPVCTPANCRVKNDGLGFGAVVNPAIMRSVLEHLITHAKELSRQGKLGDAQARI